MNSKQAKAAPLHEFLGRMGYQPAAIRGNDLWYKSPFRPQERTPSFKIDCAKNVWYDHGMGAGGTVIDFVQTGEDCGFAFNNPNVSSQCGCGEGFYV